MKTVTRALAEQLLVGDPEGRVRKAERGNDYSIALDGVLPEEQRLSIDAACGRVSTMTEQTKRAETSLGAVEMRLLVALVLSFPYPVEGYQLLALWRSQSIVEAQEDLKSARQEEGAFARLMQPVSNSIETCNQHLLPPGIAISSFGEESYQLTSTQEQRSDLAAVEAGA
jgi:hypothetical protein